MMQYLLLVADLSLITVPKTLKTEILLIDWLLGGTKGCQRVTLGV